MNAPLLEIENLSTVFPVRHTIFGRATGVIRAVDDVSFRIAPGETLGLVGESGCGKSTLARTILRLERPSAGRIRFDGADLPAARGKALRRLRRRLQVVFQDPYDSLNPRMTVMDIVTEGLLTHGLIHRRDRQAEAARLLAETGLDPDLLARYPHECSGGQRQRISIARALALRPALMICDEPVSALDVSIQSQILNLLMDLRAAHGLAYLFISHDLNVVRHLADRVAVMYLGRLVETGPAGTVLREPCHPYTRALIAAIPQAGGPRRERPLRLPGDVPSPVNPPPGCPFHPRCPFAQDRCRRERPPLDLHPGETARTPGSHTVACWRRHEIPSRASTLS